jgi:hypothetical protein
VRGWGQRGEMTQALYAHMNNKTIKKEKEKEKAGMEFSLNGNFEWPINSCSIYLVIQGYDSK